MGFQHQQQQDHKMRGIQKAIHSPRTPAHLKPHLRAKLKEHQMAQNPRGGFNPKTAAKPQMKPNLAVKSPRSQQAESRVKQAPAPFHNPFGIANAPAPAGPQGAGPGPNQSRSEGLKKRKVGQQNPAASGDRLPKGRDKVVGSAFYGE